MLNPCDIRLRLFLGAAGIACSYLAAIEPVKAEETVAYCDFPLYAVNVYQANTPESAETMLKIRVFWREKAIIFADLPASRSHFFGEGFVYTSQSGLSDDYSSSLWTLFVPDSEGQSCLLFRNGNASDSGDVTQREVN